MLIFSKRRLTRTIRALKVMARLGQPERATAARPGLAVDFLSSTSIASEQQSAAALPTALEKSNCSRKSVALREPRHSASLVPAKKIRPVRGQAHDVPVEEDEAGHRHHLGPCVQGVQQDTLRAMGRALVALASSGVHMPVSAGRRPRASLWSLSACHGRWPATR